MGRWGADGLLLKPDEFAVQLLLDVPSGAIAHGSFSRLLDTDVSLPFASRDLPHCVEVNAPAPCDHSESDAEPLRAHQAAPQRFCVRGAVTDDVAVRECATSSLVLQPCLLKRPRRARNVQRFDTSTQLGVKSRSDSEKFAGVPAVRPCVCDRCALLAPDPRVPLSIDRAPHVVRAQNAGFHGAILGPRSVKF